MSPNASVRKKKRSTPMLDNEYNDKHLLFIIEERYTRSVRIEAAECTPVEMRLEEHNAVGGGGGGGVQRAEDKEVMARVGETARERE